MKKVLLAGAALMLVGGIASTASAAAVEPGVKITGDARVRLWYMSEEYKNNFGNLADPVNAPYDSQTSMDSRVRLNVTGTAAGGAYAKTRIRMYETLMGDDDTDPTPLGSQSGNVWIDMAYVGIPFSDMFTLEVGKYRSTYGPLGTTYNFFYDDVHSTGFRGIVKINDIEINPFIEWMEEAQNDNATATDKNADNDEYRFGAHVKAKLNKDWTAGGMLGYQSDARKGVAGSFEANEGFFGSLYVNGKSGQFAIVGEVAVTDGDLNGFNSWYNDGNGTIAVTTFPTVAADPDQIGSSDTGFGGYIFPNYQIDKLNLGLNIGGTTGGFQPDRAFGFVMVGSSDNSKISDYKIGAGGDWLWIGFVPSYQINESLKLTGNIVYADIEPWDKPTDGPLGGWAGKNNVEALDSAWELSAILQYTISKGADVFFSAGYLKPEFASPAIKQDDAAFAALTRFELKF